MTRDVVTVHNPDTLQLLQFIYRRLYYCSSWEGHAMCRSSVLVEAFAVSCDSKPGVWMSREGDCVRLLYEMPQRARRHIDSMLTLT